MTFQPKLEKFRALVLEENLFLLGMYVRKFEVIEELLLYTSSDVYIAIRLIPRILPHIILLSATMLEKDRTDTLIQTLSTEFSPKKIPVLIVGQGDVDQLEKYYKQGAVGFVNILKDSLEDLIETMHWILSNHAPEFL